VSGRKPNRHMDRHRLLDEVDALAERLVTAGDMDAFEKVFGSRDPDFPIQDLPLARLREIYREYIKEKPDA
jgi:hypothetical protein